MRSIAVCLELPGFPGSDDPTDGPWYRPWCPSGRNSIEETSSGLRLLERVLFDEEYRDANITPLVPMDDAPPPASGLEFRAVDGIAAMIPPGGVPPEGGSRGGGGSRAFRILRRVVESHPDPALRRHAVHRLVLRSRVGWTWNFPSLTEWEYLARWRPRDLPLGYRLDHRLRYEDPGVLVGLLYDDDPRVLSILFHLRRLPDFEDLLDDLCKREFLAPLRLPRWFPFAEAARRFLTRGPADRAQVAYFLGEANVPGGREVLADALHAERDPELILLLKACLLALGESKWRSEVRSAFDARVAKWRENRSNIVLPETPFAPWGGGRQGEEPIPLPF